mmetsp:Transcript_50302/g.90287  ORF Transcript_50302/g.90287 Transcript_50302/m.90287 type:complete len:1528 (-) Transcript_50302:90-4673(-)
MSSSIMKFISLSACVLTCLHLSSAVKVNQDFVSLAPKDYTARPGHGWCVDKFKQEATARRFVQKDCSGIKADCDNDVKCVAYACMTSRNLGVLYTTTNCELDCEKTDWVNNPTLIKEADWEAEQHFWADANCYMVQKSTFVKVDFIVNGISLDASFPAAAREKLKTEIKAMIAANDPTIQAGTIKVDFENGDSPGTIKVKVSGIETTTTGAADFSEKLTGADYEIDNPVGEGKIKPVVEPASVKLNVPGVTNGFVPPTGGSAAGGSGSGTETPVVEKFLGLCSDFPGCNAGQRPKPTAHPEGLVKTIEMCCEDVKCPISFSTGDLLSVAPGCTCKPGYRGSIMATRIGPAYYESTCQPTCAFAGACPNGYIKRIGNIMTDGGDTATQIAECCEAQSCPPHSAGTTEDNTVAAGCTCNKGYSGTIKGDKSASGYNGKCEATCQLFVEWLEGSPGCLAGTAPKKDPETILMTADKTKQQEQCCQEITCPVESTEPADDSGLKPYLAGGGCKCKPQFATPDKTNKLKATTAAPYYQEPGCLPTCDKFTCAAGSFKLETGPSKIGLSKTATTAEKQDICCQDIFCEDLKPIGSSVAKIAVPAGTRASLRVTGCKCDDSQDYYDDPTLDGPTGITKSPYYSGKCEKSCKSHVCPPGFAVLNDVIGKTDAACCEAVDCPYHAELPYGPHLKLTDEQGRCHCPPKYKHKDPTNAAGVIVPTSISPYYATDSCRRTCDFVDCGSIVPASCPRQTAEFKDNKCTKRVTKVVKYAPAVKGTSPETEFAMCCDQVECPALSRSITASPYCECIPGEATGSVELDPVGGFISHCVESCKAAMCDSGYVLKPGANYGTNSAACCEPAKCPENSLGVGLKSDIIEGCKCKAGQKGTLWAKKGGSAVGDACVVQACPSFADASIEGANLKDGCVCGAGLVGDIIPTTSAPFYYQENDKEPCQAVCFAPADQTGYIVNEKSIYIDAWDVTATCEVGYKGTGKVTKCAQSADPRYSLSGCTLKVCEKPPADVLDTRNFEFTETDATKVWLNFAVTAKCKNGGEPQEVTRCAGDDSPNGYYYTVNADACDDAVCLAPDSSAATGHVVHEFDLHRRSFAVEASCAPGYGNPAHAATMEYCLAPASLDLYTTITEINLDMGQLLVAAKCASNNITVMALPCASPGTAYSFPPCDTPKAEFVTRVLGTHLHDSFDSRGKRFNFIMPAPPAAPPGEVEFALEGDGHCSGNTEIYSSSAWELASSSGGQKDFATVEYREWVAQAWKRCLAKDALTEYVSVWVDAGYRCYKGAACRANNGANTKTWKLAPPALKPVTADLTRCRAGVTQAETWSVAMNPESQSLNAGDGSGERASNPQEGDFQLNDILISAGTSPTCDTVGYVPYFTARCGGHEAKYKVGGCLPVDYCLGPLDATGYIVTERNLSGPGIFDVEVTCDTEAGYAGFYPVAIPCYATGQRYSLKGCSKDVCLAPPNGLDKFTITETSIYRTAFDVTAGCKSSPAVAAPDTSPIVKPCTSDGGEYTVSGGAGCL